MIVTLDFRKASRPVPFWTTGDWHLSSIHHDASLFAAHFARAVKEGWSLLHLGDALELVTPASRVAQRGALKDQIANPEEQRQILIKYLKQIKGRGVILAGNHELRVDMATGLDFIRSVTDAVGENILPLDAPQRIRILVGKQRYDAYLHHGEGPVAAPTTLFDRIQRDEGGLDLILAGHVHASTFDPSSVGSPDGERTILRLRTGHYLANPTYALVKPISRRGARGSWLLTFHPDDHHIDIAWLSRS